MNMRATSLRRLSVVIATAAVALASVFITGAGASPLANIIQLAPGNLHTCVLLGNRTVRCWGYGGDGALGNNVPASSLVPVTVKNAAGTGTLGNVAQLVSGDYHTCALLVDLTVRCWGYNGNGETGDGTTESGAPLPVKVKDNTGIGELTNIFLLSAGAAHTCAWKTDGTIRCWGEGGQGQLGDGFAIDRPLPVTVKNGAGTGTLGNVVELGLGTDTSCAVLGDGTARCWGEGGQGQLGHGLATDSFLPVHVRNRDNTADLTNVVGIRGGRSFNCALLADLTARCWGEGSQGQLGDGPATDSFLPVRVKNATGTATLGNIEQIQAGDAHVCVVLPDASARCWGINFNGQLGNGTAADSPLPVRVRNAANTGDLGNVIQLGVGAVDSCAILPDLTARCWGDNAEGQLGNGVTGNSSLPVKVLQ